jgi:histone H3/H4
VTQQGGPGGASGAATSGRGGRNAAPQQNVVPQQGVTQQNQQQGASQQNRTSRTAPPPAQNIAPQQGATQQNQQGASQQNQASRMAPPPAQNIAPQQGIGQRNQQDVIPQNQVSRAIPASAPRARAASDPRAFSGGVLRNQAFANLATARDPSVRTLASSTFQGRLFNPHWRRHLARPIVIGWVGPLFWPYAYHDFVDYTFYPYAYDTFWPYAYDDFYEGMFGAYGLGYGGTYASVGPRGGYDGGGYARRGSDRTAYARGSAGSRSVEADLCSGQTAGLTDWPIERIAQTVGPDDTQRAILDELKDATAKALDILQAACPTALPSTPTGRIEAMRQRLDAMLAAVRTVRPVVEKFYQSLNDEQKARFNALSPDNPDHQQAQRDLTQACNARASGVASVPLERIERAVQPDGAQRSALKELQNATSEAANLLSADCPTYRALTPVGRLQAMEQRLDAMLRAVQTVQPALEKFYGSLGDEQKERFNRLSPAQG